MTINTSFYSKEQRMIEWKQYVRLVTYANTAGWERTKS